jgi:hypothetical protein
MPRPKNIIPPVEVRVNIPQDLFLRLQIELFSEVDGKVPYAAVSKYMTALLRKSLEEIDRARAKERP